jgi:hypothetical protein
MGLRAKEKRMRIVIIFAVACFSTNAMAQDSPPKVGNKPLVQVKPKTPEGCKFVGTVRGTKLWSGDCATSELRSATPAGETQSLPARATGVIPPGQKQ